MIYNRTHPNLNMIIYCMLLFSFIMDMGGSFGIKNISIIVLALYISYKIMTNSKYFIPYNFIMIEGFIFILCPLILVFISFLKSNAGISTIIGQISTYILWLLYPILINIEPKEIINKFKFSIYISSILVIFTFFGIYFLYLVGRSDLILKITEFSRIYSIGFIGRRPLTGDVFIPSVFYRWTFLLIPGALLYIKDSKYKLIICLIAITFTISTGTILFTLIGIILILNSRYRIKIKAAKVIPFLILFFIVISLTSLYYPDLFTIIDFILGKFNMNNPSTFIKFEHIKSILNVLYSDVKIFLFGMGLGSSFFSTGTNSMVANVEVSHFNFIRQFGIIYAATFFAYVFLTCYRLSKTDENGSILSVGIMCIFFVTGTNPLLMSPVFFLPLVIGRAYITSYRRYLKQLKLRSEMVNA